MLTGAKGRSFHMHILRQIDRQMTEHKGFKYKNQVVSKQRVTDHGEVYTHEREVGAMLDLVRNETERIESRFLEPACGVGNFLAEVLARKLKVVRTKYKRSQLEYERYAVLAVSSIYGIDILEDNVQICGQRLYAIFDEQYSALFKEDCKHDCREAVRFILKKNIIWGDALTLQTVGDSPHPITFSEWSPINGSNMKRRDFTFHELLAPGEARELPLFSDMGEDAFVPEPVKEFPVTHFLRIEDAE